MESNIQQKDLDILNTLLDYAYDLQGEWSWKRGSSGSRNAEEYVTLEQDIEKAIQLRHKLESLLS